MTDPVAISAITNALHGNVAITYVEWASNTAVVVDWMIVDGASTAPAFADAPVGPPRQACGSNAIRSTLLDAKRLIGEGDSRATRIAGIRGEAT
jgi:hypothetical protein